MCGTYRTLRFFVDLMYVLGDVFLFITNDFFHRVVYSSIMK